MIIDRIVEPGRRFDRAFGRRHDHRISVIGILQALEIGGALILFASKTRVGRRAGHTAPALIGIIGDASIGAAPLPFAFGELDHVRAMVGDDVHIDLHAFGVGGIDQGLEVGVGPKMRIDVGEIGDPVAVISGRFLPFGTLHRLVREHRREPDRGCSKTLDVIEALA